MNQCTILKTSCIGLAALLMTAASTLSHADDFPSARLKAFQGLEDGLWQYAFSTVPKIAAIPDRTEKACVSIQAQIRKSMADTGSSSCTFDIIKNDSAYGEVLGTCNIAPQTPPMKVHYKITKSSASAIQVEAITTAPIAGNKKMTFLHKTIRVGGS